MPEQYARDGACANVRAARAGIRIDDHPATPLVPRTIEQVVYVACCLAVAIG